MNGDEQGEDQESQDGQSPKKAGKKQLAKKGAQGIKSEHAHSRFSQDPYHHTMMANFHKIACR